MATPGVLDAELLVLSTEDFCVGILEVCCSIEAAAIGCRLLVIYPVDADALGVPSFGSASLGPPLEEAALARLTMLGL